MRTTLTLEDDIAAVLASEARRKGVPFKVIVNDTLRSGLAASSVPLDRPTVKTRPHSFGFKPGIDLDRLNQLVDDLEVEAFRDKHEGRS